MAISLFQIKRWWQMLTGKSIWHVNQNIGCFFSREEVSGYYNDMTEKVTKQPGLLESDDLPLLPLEDGTMVYSPVAIFQYGLGAYDLFLQYGSDKYLHKFLQCADWALENMDEFGRWNAFYYIYPDFPYGAMAQGEGVSLLIRAYKHLGQNKYLEAARTAVDFLTTEIVDGGVSEYGTDTIVFKEYVHRPTVLNGWIFSWWGVYDFVKLTMDEDKYYNILITSLNSLVAMLPTFKNQFWSLYDNGGRIASPFYHNLHVAQMQAMYCLTGIESFHEYALLWERQQNSVINSTLAFMVKSIQKLLER